MNDDMPLPPTPKDARKWFFTAGAFVFYAAFIVVSIVAGIGIISDRIRLEGYYKKCIQRAMLIYTWRDDVDQCNEAYHR